jgi:hypothetical protein
VLLCAAAYTILTALLAHEVLGALGTRAIHDEYDPLLIAAILQWNATHVPFTQAWWQFPIFWPTPDALAFSEHFLGVSLIATPLIWLTGNPVLAANLTLLATFPLCALTAFALVRRLTSNTEAAFVAGLVYGFGPYRMSQLAHLQMLAVQWIPLALLGLHAYLETRKVRWLVLFGVAWLLQALSNGYTLFLLSALVGLWLLWFVVLQRQWRALGAVVATIAAATLPLVPILFTYLTVHARNGFARAPNEMRVFSSDALGLLCPAFEISAWSWMRFACMPEGEIFPGVVTAFLCAGGFFLLRRPQADSDPAWMTWARRVALAFAVFHAASALVIIAFGPWRFDVGPLSVHSSSLARPAMNTVVTGTLAFLLSPGVRHAIRSASVMGFYLVAGALAWLCALGPVPVVNGEVVGYPGLFAVFMALPGFSSLRVPGRFWLVATICLAVVAGLVVQALLKGRTGIARRVLVGALSVGVLVDGWELHVPSGAVPPGPPAPALLRGQQVLYLPIGAISDVFPTYYAVLHGWRSVNGYSGFEPNHYFGVRYGAKQEVDGIFQYFRTRADLHVVVAADAPRLRALVERQPGVVRTAESATAVQYRLPRRDEPVVPRSTVVKVASARASCPPARVLADGAFDEMWVCEPQMGTESITLQLGRSAAMDAVRLTLGLPVAFPRALAVETSMDGESWVPARRGDVVDAFIRGALASPTRPVLVLPFEPREAGFVRLRQTGADSTASWSMREVEVLARPALQTVEQVPDAGLARPSVSLPASTTPAR